MRKPDPSFATETEAGRMAEEEANATPHSRMQLGASGLATFNLAKLRSTTERGRVLDHRSSKFPS